MLQKLLTLSLLLIASAALAQTPVTYPAHLVFSNMTPTAVGTHGPPSGPTPSISLLYVRLQESLAPLTCPNGVVYVTSDSAEHKVIANILLTARLTGKKLQRIDIRRETPTSLCTAWLAEL